MRTFSQQLQIMQILPTRSDNASSLISLTVRVSAKCARWSMNPPALWAAPTTRSLVNTMGTPCHILRPIRVSDITVTQQQHFVSGFFLANLQQFQFYIFIAFIESNTSFDPIQFQFAYDNFTFPSSNFFLVSFDMRDRKYDWKRFEKHQLVRTRLTIYLSTYTFYFRRMSWVNKRIEWQSSESIWRNDQILASNIIITFVFRKIV